MVAEKKCDGVDRGRKSNENVMVEGKHRGFFLKKMNTNRFQKLKLSLLTLWARLEMSSPYVCYGILLAVLINLDLNKTTMIKHMRSATRATTPIDVRSITIYCTI